MSHGQPTMSELFPARRCRVGDNNLAGFGLPFAVLDDRNREALALCWRREHAQLIVDALNAAGAP